MHLLNSVNILRECASAQVAHQIVQSGVRLHNLLQEQSNIDPDLTKAISFLSKLSLNMIEDSSSLNSEIEHNLQSQIEQINDDTIQIKDNISELEMDCQNLSHKLEIKSNEFQRLNKRFESIRKIQPAFRSEFESLELTNMALYNENCLKSRTLCYLDSELNHYRMSDAQKQFEQQRLLKQVQRRLREEELRVLRGDVMLEEVTDVDVESYQDLQSFAGLVDDVPSMAKSKSKSKSATNPNSSRMSTAQDSFKSSDNLNSSLISSSITITDEENSSSLNEESQNQSASSNDSSAAQSISDASIGSISDLDDENLQF
jgi:clusterin-associated protein 1